jgi:alpha-tubulin suppressor-like RCC1 family protein
MKSLRTELRRAWLAGRHIAWQAGTAFLLAGCLSVDDPTQTGGCAPGVACVASPAAVTGSHVFTTLAAGRYHTCGLKANGEVWCWGLNAAGQLGASSSGSSSAAPIRVNGQLVFESISAGDFHTCGITADEEVYCWGSNVNSTLGVADVADTCNGLPCSRGPVRAGGATFTAVSLDVGSTHTCALDADGVAHCWGQNAVGEVGSDEFDSAFSEPNTVQGGPFGP